MPELPEVYTIASDLKKYIEGFLIEKVSVYGDYQIRGSFESPVGLIEGQRIDKIGRVAKNTLVKLSNGNFLHIHLAMTGRILLRNINSKPDPHSRVDLLLTSPDSSYILRFCDTRMFGKVQLLTPDDAQKLSNKHGPEPINKTLTHEEFHKRVTSKKTNIKNLLLDQEVVSGLGNIYATDALWMAGILPQSPANLLTKERTKKLYESARSILMEGIKHRGSTLPDEAYVDVFGKPGKHQNYFRIYGRRTCPKCQNPSEFVKLNGRGTYFCPNCQTL